MHSKKIDEYSGIRLSYFIALNFLSAKKLLHLAKFLKLWNARGTTDVFVDSS